jgi:hypothetical protein
MVPLEQFMRPLKSKPRRLPVSCFEMKTVLPQLATVFVAVLVAGIVSSASAADSFRIDSSTLYVPHDLSDDWTQVKRKGLWSRSNGTNVTEDGTFVRFLGRHYIFDYQKVFTIQGSTISTSFSFTSQATWFAEGNCVTLTQDLSRLIDSKREALEAGLGQSLADIQSSLSQGNVVPQTTTVVWAQFRKKTGQLVAWPINGLAADDQILLMPFADLALDLFENVLLPTAECIEINDPRQDLVKSGGRRMPASDSQLVSSDQFSSPTSGTKERPVRTTRPTKSKKPTRPKERFGVLVTQFEAAPGSLSFSAVGSFVKCISAVSKQQALAVARKRYRIKAVSPTERRFSYRFASSDSNECSQDQSSQSEGTEVDESSSDSGAPPSSDDSGQLPESETQPEKPFPFSDPISSMADETDGPSEVDIADLEAVPG